MAEQMKLYDVELNGLTHVAQYLPETAKRLGLKEHKDQAAAPKTKVQSTDASKAGERVAGTPAK